MDTGVVTHGLTGEPFVDARRVPDRPGAFRGVNPAARERLVPEYDEAGAEEIGQVRALAWAAFDRYRETPPDRRAGFIEAIAGRILDLRDALIERAMAETGLPR